MADPSAITMPTEPIGNIPRPVGLLERVAQGDSEDPELDRLYEEATRYTIERFEAAGSPVVTDDEQRSITISRLTGCMDFQTRPRMVLKSCSQMVIPSPLSAHTRPFPLHAVRRPLPRCRDTLRG
jgi:methionine synthase II (cobalamin-independent)